MFRSLWLSLYNLKQRFFHKVSPAEVELIKNTGLFSRMEDEYFKEMLHAVRLTRYPAGKLIFREGEQGDALYVIADGSVRVFAYNAQGRKISLARLKKGDYFGEQALLGQANKTRNANIETITSTTLIHIDEKYITYQLKRDAALKKKLKKIGFEQAVTILSSSTQFYSNIKSIIAQIENPIIKEFSDGKVIFNVGDQPDNVYIVLYGEVRLLILDKIAKTVSKLVIHKGHMFGELGILRNQPRAATAIAQGNVKLLAINGATFKETLSKNRHLKQVFSTLQQVYQIPMKGIVEQYIGNVPEAGDVITNIYKMEQGRSVVSSKFLSQDIFTMSTVNVSDEKCYKYQKGQDKMELYTVGNHITSIKAYGQWNELPMFCRLLLNNEIVDDFTLIKFELTGEFKTKELPPPEKIDMATGAASGIERPWVPATIKKIASHNAYVNSYELTPVNSYFKSLKPGQYVVIQAKIKDNWIERPYVVSDLQENGGLRVTIKKEPHSLFSQWLFEQGENELSVNVSQPQGDFTLDIDAPSQVLCFASGIGIVPFMTFAKALSVVQSHRNMHVLYSASTKDDFIFVEEFDLITKVTPSFTISYRITNIEGMLIEKDVIKMIMQFNEPDIYICGPESFVRFILNTLQSVRYDDNKIHIEEFVHASAAVGAG